MPARIPRLVAPSSRDTHTVLDWPPHRNGMPAATLNLLLSYSLLPPFFLCHTALLTHGQEQSRPIDTPGAGRSIATLICLASRMGEAGAFGRKHHGVSHYHRC